MTDRSRAVLRTIEAGGETVLCAHCERRITFKAKDRRVAQVIANVYVRGRWRRVEHFHEDCYETAGRPHGEPDRTRVRKFEVAG